jgi:hypothetical protein
MCSHGVSSLGPMSAPTEAELERVMNVARRFDVKLAEKYHRQVMEDLET